MAKFDLRIRDEIELPEDMQRTIERKAENLHKYCDRLEQVQVVLAQPHHHSQQGRLYNVKIAMGVPGKQLVVSHQGERGSHEFLLAAVRDAFVAAKRELTDYNSKNASHR